MTLSVFMNEESSWPKETIVETDEPFIDDRGEIRPIVDVPNQSVGILFTKKGAVRANHYHKTDWHYCYIVSGSIDYYERPLGSKEKPKHVKINAGQTFFTPPLVEHVMLFPEDTVFLTISRNPRTHEVYENDIVRVDLLKDI
jgi:quercetin dioxygenase-like cupin family protein